MKFLSVSVAIVACLTIFTACTGPSFSDPDEVAEAYVKAVIANDGSHTAFELTGLDPDLQQYCNLALTPEWMTEAPSRVKRIERLQTVAKGKGRGENLDDFVFGIAGEGPFTSDADMIAYIVEFKLFDAEGKEIVDADGQGSTAGVALRPDHGGQPMTKGRVFDWQDVEWKVVPQ